MNERCEQTCVHCGLPVPLSRQRGESAQFCCFGCRLVYDLGAAARAEGEGDAQPNTLLLRLGLGIFLAMNIMAVTGFFYAQQVYGHAESSTGYTALSALFSWLQLLLCSAVMATLGLPLAVDVIDNLRGGGTTGRGLRFRIDANLLILVGVLAAFGLSAYHTLVGRGHLYYDTAAMILVLVTLGGYLDSRAKQKAASSADDLLAAMPTRAFVRRGREIVELDCEALSVGDVVRVRPGEALPADGIVIEGASSVNESTLTGESNPRAVEAGGKVLAGSVNLDGQLWIAATAVGGDRVVARIRQLLHEARLQQPPIQRIADRVSAFFVPLVVLLALGVFAWRAAVGEASDGIFRALAILLISCPCALGLAAPLATWSAMARAARRGILFFSAATLERLAKSRVALFDKTGTLTRHRMRLQSITCADGVSEEQALCLAATLESSSTHPIALGLVEAARTRGLQTLEVECARTVPGRGIEATIAGERYRIGGQRWVEEAAFAVGCVKSARTHLDSPAAKANELTTSASTDGASAPSLDAPYAEGIETRESSLPCVYLMSDDRILARIVMAEELRDDAAKVVAELRQEQVRVRVLTGDQPGPASHVANQLHVPVRSQLLPADKLAIVQRYQQRIGGVVFVGDGINDGPALAAADVGIAVGGATDLARQAGHVHLLSDNLELVPQSIAIARDAMRRIHLNLIWAFGYNAIGLVLAVAGVLTPIFAASSMVISSLLIVATSRRAGAIDALDSPDHLAGGLARRECTSSQTTNDNVDADPHSDADGRRRGRCEVAAPA